MLVETGAGAGAGTEMGTEMEGNGCLNFGIVVMDISRIYLQWVICILVDEGRWKGVMYLLYMFLGILYWKFGVGSVVCKLDIL